MPFRPQAVGLHKLTICIQYPKLGKWGGGGWGGGGGGGGGGRGVGGAGGWVGGVTRNKKGALFGLKGLIREPETQKRNKGLLKVLVI